MRYEIQDELPLTLGDWITQPDRRKKVPAPMNILGVVPTTRWHAIALDIDPMKVKKAVKIRTKEQENSDMSEEFAKRIRCWPREKPMVAGVYPCTSNSVGVTDGLRRVRRYWDGKDWSRSWLTKATPEEVKTLRGIIHDYSDVSLWWSYEPPTEN